MFLPVRISRSPLSALCTVMLALACSGCGDQSVSAFPSTGTATDSVYLDVGHGKGYSFRIAYPPLPAEWGALDQAIRAFGAARKKELVAAPDPTQAHAPDSTLDLSFDVARRTNEFVSVLTRGDEYIGGAHGMPITASFNFHVPDDKLVVLTDLFVDPDAALKALSDECRRQLEGRYAAKLRDEPGTTTPTQQASGIGSMQGIIEKGTAPSASNFNTFLIDGLDAQAIGLTLIFPPYQVGSFAEGRQQVEVPAKVFYDLLKPEYKDAFAIDTEARKLGAGVR
jgi:hypothetical protein